MKDLKMVRDTHNALLFMREESVFTLTGAHKFSNYGCAKDLLKHLNAEGEDWKYCEGAPNDELTREMLTTYIAFIDEATDVSLDALLNTRHW